jgi:hypothetical protein
MAIKNLTPHEVKVQMADGTQTVFTPTGTVARVKSVPVPDGEIEGFPCVKTMWGEVENLPDPEDGVFYLVSSLVLARVSGRSDCVAPDTSPSGAIRDENNQIIAVKGFQRL